MDPRDVSIATITLARDDDERRTIVAALTELSRHGMPIAIADGGSQPAFLDDVRQLPSCTVATGHKGLVPQVKAAVRIARAAGRPFILYTEPDKREFFRTGVAQFVAAARSDAAAIVAARDAGAFATFPAVQQYTETVINTLCAQMTGRQGDYCYGPFLVNSQMADYVDRADEALGWGWRPFIFVRAKRLGLGLDHIPGPFTCPPDQRGRDETIHRLRQLSQNVDGIVAGAAGDP